MNNKKRIKIINICLLITLTLSLTACDLFSKKVKQEDFSINTEWINRDEINESDLKIETPYLTLYYPKEYTDYVTYKTHNEDDEYVVDFIGKLNKHKEKLFSIAIGTISDDYSSLGTVTDDDGVTYDIGLKTYEFGDDSWDESELDMMASMQEAMNYTINMLSQETTYTRP
ncbi:MAG: hypothetical protein PUH10_07035 [Erysipelotrichaceae bacterium]|uniref:hypothetical protein n=1 Tax=Floccifex sp. TaxID=2815810 RepID=UPI002A7503BB|nr:hypothetical protein [Floccifex sp.]MDD7281723.1 hypothetical protein [Erysipelotrichaceae bacterium]MDY2957681.1 hypothetical protein [Floccifex sp.]